MIPFFFFGFFDGDGTAPPVEPIKVAGASSKTKRFYVDDVPYDIPVTEIEYFLSNLPKTDKKPAKTVAIRAIKKTGDIVQAQAVVNTDSYAAFKDLIATQITLPTFDSAALYEYEQKRQQSLMLLKAMQEYERLQNILMLKTDKFYKARLYALLLD